MFFRDNQTLYYTTYNYNVALILDELKQIIINNGGKVKENRRGFIVNRSYLEAAKEEERRADGIRHYIETCSPDAEKAAKLEKVIKEHEATAEEYKRKADESRRPAENLSYINFTYQGYYYSISKAEIEQKLHFCKTPINARNEYSKDVYSDNISSSWLFDSFCRLFPEVPEIDDDRREAANLIFNEITAAAESEKYRDGRKTRVANVYNSGYHYETIYRPERMGKIDF